MRSPSVRVSKSMGRSMAAVKEIFFGRSAERRTTMTWSGALANTSRV